MIPYFPTPYYQLGPFHIDAFSFLVSTGFVVGSILAAKRARSIRLQETVIYDMGLLSLIFGLIGAHLTVVFVYHPEKLVQNPLWIFQFWSGISSWGGFLGATLTILFYFKKKKLPFYPYADALMFGLVPGWFLGRIGCFTTHDHPGRLTTFILASHFQDGTVRHDLGLYEGLSMVPLIGLIYFLGRKKDPLHPRSGTFLGYTLIYYALIRFFLDFLRTDEKWIMGLTPAQYFCILLIPIGFQTLKKIRRGV